MKVFKRFLISLIIICISLFLCISSVNYADENEKSVIFNQMEYSDEFKKWVDLSDEDKKNVIPPRMYEVHNNYNKSNSLISMVKELKVKGSGRFSLKDVIPLNLSIRNQENTESCWAFSVLSSLETNLALYNYNNNLDISKVYDYSERHIEYSTSKNFLNGKINERGYNRTVGDGGNWCFAESYLASGLGAISESEMPFENNNDIIDISGIQNKNVITQLYDTIDFENYNKASSEDKNNIMNQIKEHIQNYGAIFSTVHVDNIGSNDCYNNDTGAWYCNNDSSHLVNHAISIIGWDDNYSVNNFLENAKPSSDGAWIIRNSWGERRNECNVAELKESIYNNYTDICNKNGWYSAEDIPNSIIEENGYIIDGDIAYKKLGDNGIMYVSYEDANISSYMYGIIKATDIVDYDNIYQYDNYYPCHFFSLNGQKIMLANVFEKNTNDNEYLTQVAVYAPITYNCKVFVNPTGSSIETSDLQAVSLKSGEKETFNAGYHTIEFMNPVKLTGNTYSVVIEIECDQDVVIALEGKNDISNFWDSVTTETGKCFVSVKTDSGMSNYVDLGKLHSINDLFENCDSTIKAFTTNQLYDGSLDKIEIINPPTKVSYYEGENFDKTGMVIQATYNKKYNKTNILEDSDYSIENGTSLKDGQTSVTICYEGKSVDQTIFVEKNSVTKLEITNPPDKTEYIEGQSFDKTGMVVEATYKDGTKKVITDYEVIDGSNLKSDQEYVTIMYEDIIVQQDISVVPNPLVSIEVTKEPDKLEYIVGQDFDKTGMIVSGTYEDESVYEIKDYNILDGDNLTIDKTSVTIEYDGKTTTQDISVVDKKAEILEVETMPTKTEYIQYKEELDLTGGKLKVIYNDDSYELVSMQAEGVEVSEFDNSMIGDVTITVKYMGLTTQFTVKILEDTEEKAENSNFSNAKCNVKKIRYYNNLVDYYFFFDTEIYDIVRNLNNDYMEYYYFLSPNYNETTITNWVKIDEEQNYSDKLVFSIDSRKILNMSDLLVEDNVYIYIKEVAVKGSNQSILVSKGIELKGDNIEIELNGVLLKFDDSDSIIDNSIDDDIIDYTIASIILPYTGTGIIILVCIIIVSTIGVFTYYRYKKLNKYIK